MTDLPVSCICPTYGRAPRFLGLLQECVYWFTRQDYPGPKELVILNDCRDQTLICRAPGVRVVNVKEKYPTLGQKYDALVEMAEGKIILPWEDDDISLPGRISQAVEKLTDRFYFNPQQTWYQQDGILHKDHRHGVCHNASAYWKDFWKFLCLKAPEGKGAYGARTGSQDAYFDGLAKAHSYDTDLALKSPTEWTYVYRWGVSANHLSGFNDMNRAYQNAPSVPGFVVIEPRMLRDYATECAGLAQTS